jgi:hypothetical protein
MRYSGRLIDELTRLDAGEIERALDGLPDDRKHAAAFQYQARRD